MDRIAAPTRASLLRDSRTPVHMRDMCPRHAHHLAQDGTPKVLHNMRLWWQELSEYILTSLANPNVELPPLKLTRKKQRLLIKVKPRKRVATPFPVHVNYIKFQSNDTISKYISDKYINFSSTDIAEGVSPEA